MLCMVKSKNHVDTQQVASSIDDESISTSCLRLHHQFIFQVSELLLAVSLSIGDLAYNVHGP